ncbi:hypothetical protein COLO4_22900 [Corchorus olitorius]|uniref:SMP domain-containing protein n=1 Tax=Corchorus olitorius TaxID=93759 RepID=A0A1R3IJ55_9ROSI|nr:hypothetical protein COLO4_22900 [Corchorus olitorius]
MLSVFVFGFLIGVLAILGVEVWAVLYVVKRLNQKIKKLESDAAAQQPQDKQPLLDFSHNKQGVVWVLESEKIPPREQPKRKKELMLEVSPARIHARIKDKTLILTHSDACTTIPLKGCLIEAVSATNLPSRKWAKRFPIKVESKTSPLYNGSKIIYLYLETSWEKESWCKALRLASCENKEKLNWVSKLNVDFRAYLASLNAVLPVKREKLMRSSMHSKI